MDINNELYKQIENQNLWNAFIILNRNGFLKKAQTVETNLYFVISWSLKISIIDNGQEHIIRFGYKNNFSTALDSFFKEKPSELIFKL
ncbi:hypothetical protein [Marivirga arenosa]|uniref:Uncharacterized protein n=1 Tax=Marivirga arenosa TaxID=3059076 RepID=A0AA52F008_9BACT|nr:hypothetical protein [Marivirga sp. BKB1-2]WNB18861.1 hypothetical protein QYS47_31600 [Marivirga sp. BKB1-2]